MTKMRFFKYEGLGNDFILIPKKTCLNPEQIKKLCDRHYGIGADGIIFIYSDPQWTMKVWNQDGTLAQMCGNGIRCVAQWLADQGYSVDQIQTDSGKKNCIRVGKDWNIDMGIAQINGQRVSMGNPHLIIEGPIQKNKIDPLVNTEFVQILNPTKIHMDVFESGAGETLACGTGACAGVAFLVQNNKLTPDQEITVHLKGGNLYIVARQTANGLQMHMKGPARAVFEGEVFEHAFF